MEIKNTESVNVQPEVITIYLDESGNTGYNLVDQQQPIFTLASIKLLDDEALKVIELIKSNSPLEAHFKNLKRSKSGKKSIINLLKSEFIDADNTKVNIFHKEFMVTTKIVDILIETMMHLNGKDLYLNGQNIALANMLFHCFNTFCSNELVFRMYKHFVVMIRDQEAKNILDFYTAVAEVKKSSSNAEFKSTIDLILLTQHHISDILIGVDKHNLDPSIPSLFSHCVRWGREQPQGFHIIHDHSHSISKQKLIFAQFMDWTQDSIELGYDRRKFDLPLKGKSLKFADSKLHPQLQVADIVASSVAYWASGLTQSENNDELFLELNKLDLAKFVGENVIWPSALVTPEELGTVHDGGINAADNIPVFLDKSTPNPYVA